MRHVRPEYAQLREVAGALARGEDPRPCMRGVNVDALVRCAVEQRLAGLLYARLPSNADGETAELRTRLRRTALATSLTNARLKTQLEGAVRALNAAGIIPVLLKGAARMWRAQTEWQCHPSVDLDILVAPEEIEVSRGALMDAGYHDIMPERFARFYEFEHHHTSPLAIAGGVPIEVHRALGPRRLFSLDLTQRGLAGHTIADERDGMRVRLLDRTAAALHLAVHAVPHGTLRDAYLSAQLLRAMSIEERMALRRLAAGETKEQVRLEAALYDAAGLARIPWPVDADAVRCAQWALTRESFAPWVQSRTDAADAYFSSSRSRYSRFFSRALRAPNAEPRARLLLRHPLRIGGRLAVGAALVATHAGWLPFKGSVRGALREALRSSDALYTRLRTFKALAATRKPETISPETAELLRRHPALRQFVDDVRRAHWTQWNETARRGRIAAALDTLLAGPFMREYLNAELARVAHDEPLGRLTEYERRMPIFRIPGFSLSVSFVNVKRAAREIASTASVAYMAPLHDGVRIKRYRVPKALQRVLFSRELKLEELSTQALAANKATTLVRTTQAYAIEADRPEIAALVFEETQRDPLVWRFDPKTLACIGVTPSDVKITRIKETLRFIEAMQLHEAAPYVESIAKHSSHFLRWSALSTLYKLKTPTAVPLLRRATRDPHPHVRRAAHALLHERSHNGVNA